MPTATVSLKTPNPTKGNASLIFHYMGDSKKVLFFQETTHLKKAMVGYDKIVVLKFDTELTGWLDFSEKDEKLADIIDSPTKSNISKYLEQLTNEGYIIDIYIIGHGNNNKFNVSKGTYGQDEKFNKSEISDLAKNAGYNKLPIRMVWSTLCYGESINDAWLEAGAKVVGGSQFIYFYPTSFGKFAEEWNKGNVSYSAALNTANSGIMRTLVQTGLLAHSRGCLKQWGGKIWNNILDKSDAAKNYFTTMWIEKDEWQTELSGKENMNFSSVKKISGNHLLKKISPLKW